MPPANSFKNMIIVPLHLANPFVRLKVVKGMYYSLTFSAVRTCAQDESVVVTKFMVQPESHQTVQTGHLRGISNRSSVQGLYLHNQKDCEHETNFIGIEPKYSRNKKL